ncbi:16S rRNA (cytosine(967)-C(5))-methyltransferase RsmB [Marilutibacter chinensis]|uniref:16S rRNA (cytosine(967)-C(5))-methyltransferase n=1 Tax=Marilutibacter chinensis TaxID=2912247 RepID=A0ABS9HSR5_9GAMM|nr:16S rRNA (cytosine(967)-C(5))-methyltransferase RsmB [Lysobacter chinensis]MCF7221561.1 16S rRNA (cytosine(967)-C(5))-methyltransferase RsmB [Lysobacter chinensis]
MTKTPPHKPPSAPDARGTAAERRRSAGRSPERRRQSASSTPAPAASGAAPRACAARVLDAVLHRGRSLRAELVEALPMLADPRDRALVEALCFAVLRQPGRYAAALTAWMPKPPGRRDGELRTLLYLGFAQLDPLRLPAHAAVAATVEAARMLGRRHQAGMVNALLRRAQREGLPAVDPDADWPDWLRARIRDDWPEQADAVFAASVAEPPMWLRVNCRRLTREACIGRLHEAGIAAVADPHAADALHLETSMPVAALPGFADGAVSVQDLSAQCVADVLAPAAGARVLDACAAPGGKAAHLLEREPSLRLTALDVDARRLERVRETLRRLHPDLETGPDVRLLAADATAVADWWDGVPFDAVLLDAPCSATGIVRRQPDVRLHRRAADVDALVAVQAQLLDALWTTLRPGGVLVYATCSILKAENASQVEAFLARTPDARAEPLPAHLGHASGPGRQRLPGEDGGDGFFYARLRKTG